MATTARGHIEQLPSGSFRVHVYAGTDPVTGKLLAEADGDRFPNREATVGQALAKYLEVADLEISTREAHEGYVRRTIGPVLGEVKIRKLGADSLDALYTALKKCSRLCRRLPRTEHYAVGEHACDGRCGPLRDHRTTRPHACDSRCRLHACQPMSPATILRIHSIISSALDLAVRYDRADRNVAKNASPPHPRKREPDPPSPDQAARLLNLVWTEDEEYGLYLPQPLALRRRFARYSSYYDPMVAQPVEHQEDPLDPQRILRELPGQERANFLAAYREALDGAQDPAGWGNLRRVLRLWSGMAIAANRPGFYEAQEAALTGTGGGMLLEDYIQMRRTQA